MDWSTLVSVAAILTFLWLMMRGCGGMMAGGGWLLFALTVATTTWAGAAHQGVNVMRELPHALWSAAGLHCPYL